MDNFDFDELAALAQTDPQAFEQRRAQLIRQAIDQAPVHLRPELVLMQEGLNRLRAVTGSEFFIGECLKQATANTARIINLSNTVTKIYQGTHHG